MIRRKLKTLKLLKKQKIPQSSQNEIQRPHAPCREKKTRITDFCNIKFNVIDFDYHIFSTKFCY